MLQFVQLSMDYYDSVTGKHRGKACGEEEGKEENYNKFEEVKEQDQRHEEVMNELQRKNASAMLKKGKHMKKSRKPPAWYEHANDKQMKVYLLTHM